jgi:hypothetical protein
VTSASGLHFDDVLYEEDGRCARRQVGHGDADAGRIQARFAFQGRPDGPLDLQVGTDLVSLRSRYTAPDSFSHRTHRRA